MKKRKLPIATDNFKELRTKDYYYVDKTKFLEDISEDSKKVQLFIRPRRFGKTLNMSTLKYFFDTQDREENRKLFKGLYIESSPAFKYQGEHPVIFVTMKGLEGKNFEELKIDIITRIGELFKQFKFLKPSLDKDDLENFEKITGEKNANYKNSLFFLTRILSQYFNKKVILLIDEYDAPLLEAYRNGYYDDVVSFFKTLYANALKGNDYLEKGIMTGVLKVAQAGIFSDLNNISINTILLKQYNEAFGLLESEVIEALEYYEKKDNIKDVKYWYDGYKFGDVDVYNPWSIINYLEYNELTSYWIESSGNFLIKRIIEKLNSEILNNLTSLLEDNPIEVTVSEAFSLVEESNMEAVNFWQLMLYAGYLTTVKKLDPLLHGENKYLLRIPNQEVKSFFRKTFLQAVFNGENNANQVIPALRNKNIPKLIELIRELVMLVPSYHDLSEKYENSYHMLIAGFIFAVGKPLYEVKSNREAGKGRADLILTALIPGIPSYIFEFKSRKSEKSSLKTLAKNGYKQIEKKKYYIEMQAKGITDIVKIGIAFDGKEIDSYYIEEK